MSHQTSNYQTAFLCGSLVMLLASCGPSPANLPRVRTPVGQGESADRPVQDRIEEIHRATKAFYAAVTDADAVQSVRLRWQAIYADRPQDTKVSAYYGAATVLAAGHALWPWEKGRLAREGMALLDQAVTLDPDDLEVRFLRGMTNYRLPPLLGRSALAAEDLGHVAARARPAADAGLLDRAVAAAALYHHGMLLAQNGDGSAATAACRAARAVGPDTSAGRAAAVWLADNRELE